VVLQLHRQARGGELDGGNQESYSRLDGYLNGGFYFEVSQTFNIGKYFLYFLMFESWGKKN